MKRVLISAILGALLIIPNVVLAQHLANAMDFQLRKEVSKEPVPVFFIQRRERLVIATVYFFNEMWFVVK